jgi:hypothetical protein
MKVQAPINVDMAERLQRALARRRASKEIFRLKLKYSV